MINYGVKYSTKQFHLFPNKQKFQIIELNNLELK